MLSSLSYFERLHKCCLTVIYRLHQCCLSESERLHKCYLHIHSQIDSTRAVYHIQRDSTSAVSKGILESTEVTRCKESSVLREGLKSEIRLQQSRSVSLLQWQSNQLRDSEPTTRQSNSTSSLSKSVIQFFRYRSPNHLTPQLRFEKGISKSQVLCSCHKNSSRIKGSSM